MIYLNAYGKQKEVISLRLARASHFTGAADYFQSALVSLVVCCKAVAPVILKSFKVLRIGY